MKAVPFLCEWCQKPVEFCELTPNPADSAYRLFVKCHGWQSLTRFELTPEIRKTDFVIFKKPKQLNFDFQEEKYAA